MTTIANYQSIFYERVMMIGEGGEGKTTLFETLPGKKLMLAWERNAITALKAINPNSSTEFELFSPGELNITVERVPKGGAYSKEVKHRADAYAKFESYCTAKMREGYFDQFDWVAIDGATQMARAMMDDVLAREGRLGYVPEQSDYNIVKTQMERVLRLFCAMDISFYFVVHLGDITQNETTKRIIQPLILPGDLRSVAKTMFSQVFRTDVDEDSDGNVIYTIQTRPDRYNKGPRTSIRGLPKTVDVTIKETLMLERTGLGKLFTEQLGFKTKAQQAKLAERKLAAPPKEGPDNKPS